MVISKTEIDIETKQHYPYRSSLLIQKLQKRYRQNKPLRIAFLDIDATMTGNKNTTNKTRKQLEQLGYSVVYVTARTEEMIMSSTSYHSSKKYGFDRPEPHIGVKDGKYTYVQPELIEPEGILDPDVIAGSTGSQILIRLDNGAYVIDKTYNNKMLETSEAWRTKMLSLINGFNKDRKRAFLSQLEYIDNYTHGITDVAPQRYRIGLLFQSPTYKRAFRAFVHTLKIVDTEMYNNIHIMDDSLPHKELYLLTLTPKNASKTKAVEHIIDQVCNQMHIARSELQVLIAGDNFPDIDMGLRAAKGTHATFLLAGGSRLAHALTCAKKHEEIFDEHFQELKECLSANKQKGYYNHRNFALHEIIVCDEVCKGKKAVDSIFTLLPFLHEIEKLQ